MLKFRRYLWISGLVLLSGYFRACTSNPFFKENYYELEKISGQVILNDGVRPDSILVWCDGLELLTYTDRDGKFSLTIPPPEMQEGQSGLNGSFGLYFYLANYAIDSRPIRLTEGHLEKAQQFIDNDGWLRAPVTLIKLLDISTEVSPTQVSSDWQDTIEVDVRLLSYADGVTVRSLIWNKPFGSTTITYHSGIILRPLDNPKIAPVFIYNPDILYYDYHLPKGQLTVWPIKFLFDASILAPGDYEVSHFCWVIQDGVPQEIIDSFGEMWDWLDTDYLKIPLKRNCAILTILP